MPPLSDDELNARLHTLSKDYLARLPNKFSEVSTAWSEVLKKPTTQQKQDFARLIHNLAGSGATFGFEALSNTARNIESFIQLITKDDAEVSEEQRQQIETLLTDLRNLIESSSQEENQSNHASFQAHPPYHEHNESHMVFLIESDLQLAEDIVMQLNPYSYIVRTFHTANGVIEAIDETPPVAIIIDQSMLRRDSASPLQVDKLKAVAAGKIPIIYISIKDDMAHRLQAVREGGNAFFSKPLEVNNLIDTLDHMTNPQGDDAYRILIIDDSESLASYYSLTLNMAGMITEVVTSPMEMLNVIEEFGPELILLDMYFPNCNGIELASIIRQQASYLCIPIVFLSGETNIEKQLDAISSGGDDFLTKPISPTHLISSVSSRAKRYRSLRSMMIRDSLTGLLNHTAIKEQLEVELFRAKREKTPLSFAMLDIDHFKSVNDNYGHPAGDQVIKGLSRLLQQRLRKSDMIGRYGGEEFAVILPNTTQETAEYLLNELREGFSQIKHKGNNEKFQVTLSCGIASLSPSHNADELNDAADQALYQAKHGGRNQVVIFSPASRKIA